MAHRTVSDCMITVRRPDESAVPSWMRVNAERQVRPVVPAIATPDRMRYPSG
jgi:hypothetical protein